MFVREIMNKNSVVCTEDASLEEVFELMTKSGGEYVTVVESRAHRIPIGTITEHDICLQIIGRQRNPRGMTAANVMNTNIVKAIDSLSLAQCRDLMQIKQAKRVFVVDEDGMLCGTLSHSELEKAETEKRVEKMVGGAAFYTYSAPGINRIF